MILLIIPDFAQSIYDGNDSPVRFTAREIPARIQGIDHPGILICGGHFAGNLIPQSAYQNSGTGVAFGLFALISINKRFLFFLARLPNYHSSIGYFRNPYGICDVFKDSGIEVRIVKFTGENRF
jgi:hypothetical protein